MSEKEFRLDGRIILVSGAAGLIGREVCDAFAAYGADVVISDVVAREQLTAQAIALSERYPGVAVEPVRADITRNDDVQRLTENVMQRFGRLDVLVNLAAIDAKFDAAAGDINPSRFEHYPLDLWEQSVAVNMTGLLRLTQAAARMMLEQRSGNIINVASTYSLVAPNQALYRFPGQESQTYKPVDYVGTKSFVPNFTRYLATLYAGDGIRANTIVPHGVDNRHDEAFKQNFKRYSPLGRLCNVRELRGPFVFLASDASSYMTGSTLVVDGGWTAW